jgi:hypothetical protein
MPVAVLPRKLTDDVLHDNHNWDIPEDFYETSIAPLLKDVHRFGICDPSSVTFDPARHLLFTDDYYEKTKRLTLKELGVVKAHQEPISPIGVSEPFPLFTQEAIAIMRYELFQKECFLNCGRINDHSTTGDMDFYVRGYAKKYTPFSFQAWQHPKVLEIISTMAGVELVHQFDYEIGHINVSMKQATTKIVTEEASSAEEIPGIVSWHFDSPQFVCVLMMSDTTNMIGGETALMMGDGKVAKVEGPKQGWCNILQGRILKHIATKPRGDYTERITSVCSFRPKNTMLDDSPITTVKPSELSASRFNDFYQEYMNYRLDVLQDRINALKSQINGSIEKGERFNQLDTIEFIQKKIVEYAEHTWQEFEVVDDGLVERPKSYNVIQCRWD